MAFGLDALRRLLRPLELRLAALVSRGVASRVDDKTLLQELQVRLLAGEVRGRVERFQEFGFSSVPPAGSEAVVLSVGATRDHAVALGVEHRASRPKGLAEGDVQVYSGGLDFIRLTAEDHQLRTVSELVRVQAEDVEVDAGGSGQIRLVCGQSEILIEPTRITITSPNIDLNKP